MQWYVKALQNYTGFQGRATRTEYWMFVLVNFIITIVISILERILHIRPALSGLYGLVLLLPSLALTARRLHDTGRSGWWQLIGIIPIIGFIVMLVFTVQDSQPDENQHGPNPKQVLQ